MKRWILKILNACVVAALFYMGTSLVFVLVSFAGALIVLSIEWLLKTLKIGWSVYYLPPELLMGLFGAVILGIMLWGSSYPWLPKKGKAKTV